MSKMGISLSHICDYVSIASFLEYYKQKMGFDIIRFLSSMELEQLPVNLVNMN